ncbi:MAG: hypothetical protein PHW04_10440 [Candidatus Wallbacteria bacterium]|nr:hypothetical protein [Candidatus Wallbacteria bacterium]
MASQVVEYSLLRLKYCVDEINRLKQDDFAYDYPRMALIILEKNFNSSRRALEKISVEGESALTVCCAALDLLQTYLPIMGFIIRSTKVRIAFEFYFPLLELTKRIFDEDLREDRKSIDANHVKLIVASEWEYSPYNYLLGDELLKSFVCIGLSATESSNPLIIPIAGHEIGHTLWLKLQDENSKLVDLIKPNKYNDLIDDQIRREIEKSWDDFCRHFPGYKKEDLFSSLYLPKLWEDAQSWALRQVEEVFCDFIGIRIFAESYLHAFTYLTTPGHPTGTRSSLYPDIRARVKYLCQYAQKQNVALAPNLNSFFLDESESLDPSPETDHKPIFLLEIADKVVDTIVEEIMNDVNVILSKKSIPVRNQEKVDSICNTFESLNSPILGPEEMVDIINAGWQCFIKNKLFETPKLSTKLEEDRKNEKARFEKLNELNDMILKSLEIIEISRLWELPE